MTPPSHWEELCLDNSTHVLVEDPQDYLQDDWLTDQEREESIIKIRGSSLFALLNRDV
jgi:hypothetical protein